MVRRTRRIITAAGIAVIGALVSFMLLPYIQNSKNAEFKKSIDSIAFDSISLTQEYQGEEGKWGNNQYDNKTMIAIVDKYLPKYQELIDRAKALDTPERYTNAKDLLIKSMQAEKDSNEHFRNYLATGDAAEREKSDDLFNQAFAYSGSYDAAIKAAG